MDEVLLRKKRPSESDKASEDRPIGFSSDDFPVQAVADHERKKSLQTEFRKSPLDPNAPVGAWTIDRLTLLVPWLNEYGISSEIVLRSARLGVLRARKKSETALRLERRRRAKREVLSKNIDFPLGGMKLRPLQDVRLELESIRQGSLLPALFNTQILAAHLGLEWEPVTEFGEALRNVEEWAEKLQQVAKGVRGDKGRYELDAFISYMGKWWKKSTGREPALTQAERYVVSSPKYRPHEGMKKYREGQQSKEAEAEIEHDINFVSFVKSAWRDAGGSPADISRAIKRVLQKERRDRKDLLAR